MVNAPEGLNKFFFSGRLKDREIEREERKRERGGDRRIKQGCQKSSRAHHLNDQSSPDIIVAARGGANNASVLVDGLKELPDNEGNGLDPLDLLLGVEKLLLQVPLLVLVDRHKLIRWIGNMDNSLKKKDQSCWMSNSNFSRYKKRQLRETGLQSQPQC